MHGSARVEAFCFNELTRILFLFSDMTERPRTFSDLRFVADSVYSQRKLASFLFLYFDLSRIKLVFTEITGIFTNFFFVSLSLVQQDTPEIAVQFMNLVSRLNPEDSGLRHPAEAVHFLSLLAGSGTDQQYQSQQQQQPYYNNRRSGYRYTGLYNVPDGLEEMDIEDSIRLGSGPTNTFSHGEPSTVTLGQLAQQFNRHQGMYISVLKFTCSYQLLTAYL